MSVTVGWDHLKFQDLFRKIFHNYSNFHNNNNNNKASSPLKVAAALFDPVRDKALRRISNCPISGLILLIQEDRSIIFGLVIRMASGLFNEVSYIAKMTETNEI